MTEQERKWFEKLHNQKEVDKSVLLRPDYIGLWKSVIDKYSDKAHFIYELIQNADDACATFIKFDLQENGLWVLHNGKERFSVTDPDDNTKRGHINSITSIGVSTKIDEQKIGKFGVGFKAVFAYTETPKIYDNFNFKIENYIVPTEIEPTDYERKTNETLFHFPFDKDKSQKSAEEAYKDILKKLNDLIYPTLFLSKLEEVSWKTRTENGKYMKKIKQTQREGNMSYEKIELLKEIGLSTTNETLWLFKRFIEEDKNHPYSVGFFLDEEGKLRKKQLAAFCFFPTKENTELNFIVHAPFLLNDSREGIKEDNWNKELLHKLAELSADSLLVLKGLKLIDDNIIDIIPYRHSIDFSEQFYHKIKSKFQTEELLSARNGEFAKKENAYWVEYDYIKLLSDEQISDLMLKPNSRLVFRTMDENTVSRENSDKKDYINSITSGVLRTSSLLSKITDIFIKKQSFNWLHDFYKKFLQADEHKKIVKTKPIFKDENGNAVPAFDMNGHLILFLPAGEKNDYITIHPELWNNENSREFIKNFGIKQPSLKDEIYNKILPLYNNNDGIDTEPHFLKFFKYYKDECPLSETNNFIDLLKDKAFVLTKSSTDDIYYRGKASEIYYPTEDLKKYFETKPDTKFLNLEFYHDLIEEKYRDTLEKFLLNIGIVKYPRIILIETEYSALDEQQQKQVRLRYTQKGRRPKYFDKKIDGCREIMDKIKTEKDKSILLWKQLLDMIRYNDNFYDNLSGKHEYYRYDRKDRCATSFDSSALILLTQEEWLVTKKEKFASANKISINELSDDYDTESECAQKLIKFLKINEQYLDDDSAMKAGFKNAEEAKKAREIWNKYSTDRRIKKIVDEYSKARPKTFEPMVINVRTSSSKDSKSYLQEKNTNDDKQLVCQICKKEMPFRKKDGEYYFEITEIFSKTDILTKEMEEPYLALCPVCAAKYRSGGFVDDDQKNKIKEKILNENIEANKDYYEIPISLDYETTICFAAKHFKDLKTILELSSSPQITHNVEDSKDKFANLNSTEEEQQIEKVKRRIGKWFAKKEQKNSRILYAFIKLFEKNNGIVTFKELKQETEMEDFEVNFNQMKNFDPHNHGKIFEQEGESIRFWEKVENIIWDYYEKI